MSDFFTSPDFLFVAVSIALLLIAGAVLYRNVRWSSRGITHRAPAPVAAGAAAAVATAHTKPTGVKGWLEKYVWSLVFAAAGAAVFYWGLYTPGLRLSEVGGWSWNHWLSLPAFCGFVLALIKLNEDVLGKLAETLRSWMVLAMFLLFFGIPGGFWVRDAFLPARICQDGSTSSLQFCKLNTAWSTMFRAAEGRAADGTNLCYSPSSLVEYEAIEKDGTTFNRFRSKEGEVEVKYIFMKLPPGEKKCPEI